MSVLCLSSSGPFQDVKEYADDLETAFKLLLEVRDVSKH